MKNNGTKYFLISDDSCEEICNSKAVIDNVTAGKRRGLGTFYIEHILFHQRKLRRDVELQNTHSVLSDSLRDVMQVSMLIAQLGRGLEIVDWYRDATSDPHGHFLIDFLLRTDKIIRFCIIKDSVPSKFDIPDRLNRLNSQNI